MGSMKEIVCEDKTLSVVYWAKKPYTWQKFYSDRDYISEVCLIVLCVFGAYIGFQFNIS